MTKSRRRLLLGAAAALPVGRMRAQSTAPADPAVSPEAPDSERFRAAALSGDLGAVNRQLDRDPALLYSRDRGGNSVYTLACLAGQGKVAEALAARGLVLDIFEAVVSGNTPRATELLKTNPGAVHLRSTDGRTPLHYAVAAARPDMVMFLLGRGANLSAGPESPGLGVADSANSQAAAEMAQILFGNGSDPNAKRGDGRTVLHLAAARGNAEVARVAIHRGAALEARDAQGKTPLDIAAGPAARLLREAAGIDRAYYGGRYRQDLRGNPYQAASTEDLPQDFINQFVTFAHFDFDRVKRLHKLCPALLDGRATWDEMAIEASAHVGQAAMTEYLAEAGAPVSTCTATLLGLTSTVAAMIREDPGRLRERGAHDFPLLFYTGFGPERVEIADLLLRAGAAAGVELNGQTPLHIAAFRGHVELARLLLDRGADVNAVSRLRGAPAATPLAVALARKQTEVADLLRHRGGRV